MEDSKLPASADLGQLRAQAKELKRAYAGGNPAAQERVKSVRPAAGPDIPLREAQLVIAREQGFDSWRELAAAAITQQSGGRDLNRWFGVELNNGTWDLIDNGLSEQSPPAERRAGSVRGVRGDLPLDAGRDRGRPRPRRAPHRHGGRRDRAARARPAGTPTGTPSSSRRTRLPSRTGTGPLPPRRWPGSPPGRGVPTPGSSGPRRSCWRSLSATRKTAGSAWSGWPRRPGSRPGSSPPDARRRTGLDAGPSIHSDRGV